MQRFRPSATFAGVGTRLALSAVLVCLAGGIRPATPAGAAACSTSGATLFSSGYIRDFTSAHTDFNVADGDATTSFVAPTLGADGKPTLASGASPTTVKSAASFAQWWNDDPIPAVSQKSIASYILSNACQPDPRVYEYVASPFYPIDNQLLGNGGSAHNSWFTYEAHNYLTYQGGEVLQYSSADDMWVYINGHLAVDLGGVHPLKTASVSLDAAQSALSITLGNVYPVAIFYAHRGQHAPALGIQLTPSVLCNVFASAATVTPAGADLTLLGAASLNAGNLRVMKPLTGPGQAAGWYHTPLSIAPGFSTDFDFTMTPASGTTAEGFAFVVQSQGQAVVGGDASNLGYAGINNSLAVEFDTHTDVSLNDPARQHMSVHTAGAAQNNASETYSIGTDNAARPLTLSDGLSQHVRIEYWHGSSAATGWIRLFTYENSSPINAIERVRPSLQAQVSPAQFATIAAPNAFLGFTAAADNTVQETVDITNWTMKVVPASASQSRLVQPPAALVAGQAGQVSVQLRDVCNNPLGVGGTGLGSSLQAQLTAGSSPAVTVPTAVTGNADGSYTLAYTPTVAGTYQLSVALAGNVISGSPFALNVSNASAATTTTSITAATGAAVAGQPVAVSYAVLPTTGSGTPTGSVTVSDSETDTCTGTVSVGSCAITFANVGTYTLTATYGGDPSFGASTSALATQQVMAAPTVTPTTVSAATPTTAPTSTPTTTSATAPASSSAAAASAGPAPRPDLAGARIQAAGGPALYLVDEDGTARHIPDPPTYLELFRDWAGIQIVDPSTIAIGPAITSGAYLATSPLGGKVYLVDRGQKRWITSPAVMDKFYFAWGQIRQVAQSTLDTLPDGPAMN